VSWAKLDDRFWIHPKVTAVGNAGAGIFGRMLSYCGCFLTNGLVPADAVTIIVGDDRAVLQRMHDLGMVEIRESGSVFIRDYLDYNPDRDKVEADKEAARERMRKRRNGVGSR
jgi:hypothetical protein